MPTMELTDHEVALVTFHRMTPVEQAAERERLQTAAREAALARLTPERREIAEKRRAEALASIEAERQRVEALTQEERNAEMALRQKAAAEKMLAALPQATVDKMTVALATPIEAAGKLEQ